MKYYLLLIELFALMLYVVPKLTWNFFRYRATNGALKIRITLAAMAVFKILHIFVLLQNDCNDMTYYWSFMTTAAFISLFVFSERHHDNRPT